MPILPRMLSQGSISSLSPFRSCRTPPLGKHPIADASLFSYSPGVNSRNFPRDRNPKPDAVSRLSAAHFNQSRINLAPPTGPVSGKACFNYANRGLPAGHEETLREAEARLFGGILRETQMRPGSPLFKTESYKQDSTATIKESLNE